MYEYTINLQTYIVKTKSRLLIGFKHVILGQSTGWESMTSDGWESQYGRSETTSGFTSVYNSMSNLLRKYISGLYSL